MSFCRDFERDAVTHPWHCIRCGMIPPGNTLGPRMPICANPKPPGFTATTKEDQMATQPQKDLGPVFAPGDVVYSRMAWVPWPGIVTEVRRNNIRVCWWSVLIQNEENISAYALTTKMPLPFLALAFLALLAGFFFLGMSVQAMQ